MAVSDFNEAIERQRNEIVFYDNLAAAYLAFEQDDVALSELTQAMDQDPENPYRCAARAGFYVGRNNHKAALADINRAIGLKPEDGNLLMQRCTVYILMGERENAMADVPHPLHRAGSRAGPWLFYPRAYAPAGR